MSQTINIMSLTTLSSKDLSRIQKLVERKESLIQQIADINGELEAIESGDSKPARPVTSPNGTATAPSPRKSLKPTVARKIGKSGKTGRGQLKERLTAELK